MLSILNKSVLSICCISLFFVGCTQKKYGYGYGSKSYSSGTSSSLSYSSSSYSSSTPTKVNTSTNTFNSNTTIRNSKAMHRATMRPYEVFGKKYYPTLARVNDRFTGVASWYGPKFHAKKTSNGEIYNMYANTAAHKTLPMNTIVKVVNQKNGKSVIVRINDRGPFVAGRIIDLSNKAAHAIDMVKEGTVKVKLTVLGFNGKIATTQAEKKEVQSMSNYYVQVGAFSKIEGALSTKRKFDLVLEKEYKVILKDSELLGKPVKRVWISGFRSEQEAQDFKDNNNLKSAMIIAQ